MVKSKLKSGRSGILNRTNAPKFGVDNPMPNANATQNTKQKVRNALERKYLSVVSGFLKVRIEMVKKSNMVVSIAENSIIALFTLSTVGP